jgi:hypothetical protein
LFFNYEYVIKSNTDFCILVPKKATEGFVQQRTGATRKGYAPVRGTLAFIGEFIYI